MSDRVIAKVIPGKRPPLSVGDACLTSWRQWVPQLGSSPSLSMWTPCQGRLPVTDLGRFNHPQALLEDLNRGLDDKAQACQQREFRDHQLSDEQRCGARILDIIIINALKTLYKGSILLVHFQLTFSVRFAIESVPDSTVGLICPRIFAETVTTWHPEGKVAPTLWERLGDG